MVPEADVFPPSVWFDWWRNWMDWPAASIVKRIVYWQMGLEHGFHWFQLDYTDQKEGVSYPLEIEFEFTTWAWVQATAGTAMGGGFQLVSHHWNGNGWWPFSHNSFALTNICQQTKKTGSVTAGIALCGGPELKLRWWTETLPRLYRIHEGGYQLSMELIVKRVKHSGSI